MMKIGIVLRLYVSKHNNAVMMNDELIVIRNRRPLSYLSAMDPAQTLNSKIGIRRQKLTSLNIQHYDML